MENRELTYGQKAVGITFNPGQNEEVNAIKEQFAHVIDTLNDRRDAAQLFGNQEAVEQLTIAIRYAQTAQMWGVKAVTWQY